ncbi:MAG TPA: tetratricopeptide repeat protein [Patescibacteria group bacterium]|nr:tetratricopeptide repeat protein [Patescibacteria group bacterium]
MEIENKKVVEGDIIVTTLPKDNKFYPYKVLKIESWPDESITWHVLGYVPLDYNPTEKDISKLSVRAWHIPIRSFEDKIQIITHSTVTENELQGYFEYLKLTDFPRYIKETGKNIDEVIKKANEYYAKGNELSDAKQYDEAIEAYTLAAEEFPLLFEAIDNRGFAKMDMGKYQEAISDFEESLQVKPDNFTAQFSLAECYYRLKEYQKAQEEAERAITLKDEPLARDLLQKIKENL